MISTLLFLRRDKLIEELLTMNNVSDLRAASNFSAVPLRCIFLLRLNIQVLASNIDGAKAANRASKPMIASGVKLILDIELYFQRARRSL
jgi:hypothetical protein